MTTTRKKILVVDDDAAVTAYLEAKLGAVYHVVATNVSTRALTPAQSGHPDLIICDVDMPEQDGGDRGAVKEPHDPRHSASVSDGVDVAARSGSALRLP